MFELLRLDPFCRHYKQWEKTGQYKKEKNGEILQVLKDNLEVIKNVKDVADFSKLKFESDGKIIKTDNPTKTKLTVKARDITKFNEFVDKYCQEHIFNETDAKAMRILLTEAQNAEANINIGSSSSKLNSAADHVLYNEKVIFNNTEETKGTDFINSQFEKTQSELQKSQKALADEERKEGVAMANTMIYGGVGFSSMVLSVPLLVFLPPVGLGVLVAGVGMTIWGLVALFLSATQRDRVIDATKQVENCQHNLKSLNTLKMHYNELEFKTFIANLPADKKYLEFDETKFKDLHKLYDRQKRQTELDSQIHLEGDDIKKIHLNQNKLSLGKEIASLKQKLGLPTGVA